MADGEWFTAKAVVVRLAQERGADASSAYCGRCRAEAGVHGDLVHEPDCRATLKDIKFKVGGRSLEPEDY